MKPQLLRAQMLLAAARADFQSPSSAKGAALLLFALAVVSSPVWIGLFSGR